jgi:hypothetical protein
MSNRTPEADKAWENGWYCNNCECYTRDFVGHFACGPKGIERVYSTRPITSPIPPQQFPFTPEPIKTLLDDFPKLLSDIMDRKELENDINGVTRLVCALLAEKCPLNQVVDTARALHKEIRSKTV